MAATRDIVASDLPPVFLLGGNMHTVLDLFSGIGGFSLGLERVGGGGYFETAAFCEDNEPCQRVLNKHWPEVKILGRVANGVPGRVDRLKQLGNSVVPQIPQMIGEAIMEYEQRSAGAGRDRTAGQPGGPACPS